MAFFRFSRDKRGYEHFYLVEPVTNRKGKSRTRVLYWYRTPPNVKVGRAPFDDEARRALETQYPAVEFDWDKIVDAPIPSAEAEKWRERRRGERVERAARRSAEATDARDDAIAAEGDPDADLVEQDVDSGDAIAASGAAPSTDSAEVPTDIDSDVAEVSGTGEPPADLPAVPGTSQGPVRDGAARRRRRRRRGRGDRDHAHREPSVAAATDKPLEQAADPDSQSVPPDDPIERFGE